MLVAAAMKESRKSQAIDKPTQADVAAWMDLPRGPGFHALDADGEGSPQLTIQEAEAIITKTFMGEAIEAAKKLDFEAAAKEVRDEANPGPGQGSAPSRPPPRRKPNSSGIGAERRHVR